MEDKIRIIHLGGQDEKGKPMTVIEINDDLFVINCGIKFPDKTKQGIDFSVPRCDYIIENKDRIRAYFMTSGSPLNMGGLAYVYKRAPAKVYCTKVASKLSKIFCDSVKAKVDFDFEFINPSDERIVAGRKIRFFQTATNSPHTYGIAISTDKGNIIYVDDFVIDNNVDYGYQSNTKTFVSLGQENTLILMCGSRYSVLPGYSNPKYKIVPMIEKIFRNSLSRIYIALNSLDIYSIEMVCKLAIREKRVIIPYDHETKDFIYTLIEDYKDKIPDHSFGDENDAFRIEPSKVLILMIGHSVHIYNKIALIGSGHPIDNRFVLKQGDTFILGLHENNRTDVKTAEAIDELYHNEGLHIYYFKKKQFIKMCASEEDIKTMLSTFRPKYYMPIYGDFKLLLANAKISVDMGLGLNPNNVFVLDNGMILEIDNLGSKVLKENVTTGEVLVDGYEIAINDLKILEDRKTLSRDGIIVISARIDKDSYRVSYGPDVASRGIVGVNEKDKFNAEIAKVFMDLAKSELSTHSFDLTSFKNEVCNATLRVVRRKTLKSPMIYPIIFVD